MKEKLKMMCPKCGSENTKKYGKRNEIQRYQCKNCKYTFLETRKRVAFAKNEKAVLSMLINLLNADEETKNVTIKEAIANVNVENLNINNFRFIQRSIENEEEIECYNPKLLICEDYGIINIYNFKKRESKDVKSRIFSIVDDDTYSKMKNIFKDKIMKEKKRNKKLRPMEYAAIKRRREIFTYEEQEESNNYQVPSQYNMNGFNRFI